MSTDSNVTKETKVETLYYEDIVKTEYQFNTVLLDEEKKDYCKKRFPSYEILCFSFPEPVVLKKSVLLGKVIVKTTDGFFLLGKVLKMIKDNRLFVSFNQRDGFFGYVFPLDKAALEWASLFHWKRSKAMVVWPNSNKIALSLAREDLKDAFETFWSPCRASPPDHRDDGDWSGGWKRSRGRLPSYPLRKARASGSSRPER